MIMRLITMGSAYKHNVTRQAIIDVISTGDFLGADTDGLLWWIGTADDGRGYEVAGFYDDTQHVVFIIHAMRNWRKK